MLAPDRILHLIATDQTVLTAHFFATVGMFMIITGGLFLQALLTRADEAAIPFWIGLQKAAAAALVSWAVVRGLMLPLAYLVAGFDAITAVIVFIFWVRLDK